MPSLLYLGHWTGSAEHEHDSSEVQEAAAEHAAHCHYGPASCSQQQQIAVNARVLPNVVELEQPSLQSIELTNATLALEEYIAATPTDPPQL